MVLILARCCLVAAGVWLASADYNTSNSTRLSMDAAQTLATQSAEVVWKTLMQSKAEAEARVRLINTSLQKALTSRSQALAEIALAREERGKRRAILERANEDLNTALEDSENTTRGALHLPRRTLLRAAAAADAGEAVASAKTRLEEAVRAEASASEQAALAVQHAMEATERAKGMERALRHSESILHHDAKDELAMEMFHQLAMQANLAPEDNATEAGLPELNETIEHMEMALREAHEQWARVQARVNDMTAKERHLRETVKVLANHTKVLKGYEVKWYVSSGRTKAEAQRKLVRTQQTQQQIQHTKEVMDTAKHNLEAVQKRRELAKAKAKDIKQQRDDLDHAIAPALRAGRRLAARQ